MWLSPQILFGYFFGPTIPTSFFNFIQLFFILVTVPFLFPSEQSRQLVSFNYTILHGLRIQFSTSLWMVKTIKSVFSLISLSNKYFVSILMSMNNIVFYVCECVCIHIKLHYNNSVFSRSSNQIWIQNQKVGLSVCNINLWFQVQAMRLLDRWGTPE
jgi:hypothetical protein